jgi:competence ComEA-like helix-hairpin-helix protein
MNIKKTVLAGIALLFSVGFLFDGVAADEAKKPSNSPGVAKMDLNKATAEQLSECPGITPALAKAIVAYRAKSGPFKAPEDLLKVKGISKEILDKINPKMEKDKLYVIPAASDEDEEPSLKPSKC